MEKKQKNKHCPKIVKRIYLVEFPINIVGKITSEIGVPWLRWTNQINNSTIGVDINDQWQYIGYSTVQLLHENK
jgi:hypothetical protein